MELSGIIKKFPEENTFSTQSRPYFNHSVAIKGIFTAEERAAMLNQVGLNVFFFPAEMVTGCDLLSDSGTTTMTNEQWAALHLGDEAYGSNQGYFLLGEQIRQIFGETFFNQPALNKPNAFIFHQGRPAEDALFSLLGKMGSGLIIPSNGHFDTTQANIEANGIQALNLFSSALMNNSSAAHFKGNIDIGRLKKLLQHSYEKIPLVYLTITNNTGGGQAVAMENIKQVAELAHHYKIPLFLDACRFAENSWLIKQHEEGYENKTIKDIVQEIFSYVDGFTISFKKDGLVNMGGGLFIKNEGLFMKKYPRIPEALTNLQIIKEGHPTYGGLSGRNIMTLVIGLKLVLDERYLAYRINQVQQFGYGMQQKGLPVLTPIGGHAVYLDMNKFFAETKVESESFPGIAFTAILLAAYGHRACELGHLAFGSYDEKAGREITPEINFVRFAVPRLRYEKQDLDSVVGAVYQLYQRRDEIPPVEITYGQNLLLRHFKARFKFS